MNERFNFAIFLLLFILASCDPCGKVNCLNGGVCMDGECKCPNPFGGKDCTQNLCEGVNCIHGECNYGNCDCNQGYEGAYCANAISAKFVGTFRDAAMQFMNVQAVTPFSSSEIEMNPIEGVSIIAKVSGYNITVQGQSTGNYSAISGSGSISQNLNTISLQLSFTLNGSTVPQIQNYTYTRL